MRGNRYFLLLLTVSAFAQTARITNPIDESRRITLQRTVPPRTRAAVDLGPVERGRPIGPVVVLLKRSPEQQAAIEKLLTEQRDPGSLNFHKWLTPEQYADRFGLLEEDLSTLRSWIESHGLTIDHSARGRNWIGFSGTTQQIEAALGTQIHRYQSGAEEHFANSTEISIPAALEPVAGAFIGLDDFRPQPRYTSSHPTEHSLAPGDLGILYDILPLYNSGIDGTGQAIAVVGQSDLEPDQADITAFRNKFHLPGSGPLVVQYGADPGYNGSVSEADFDLEWATAIVPNAQIIYVNSVNVDVSSIYAIDQNLAPVISRSYGVCEQEKISLADLFQSVIQQGNAQGITYVASSGDAGPSNCTGWFYEPSATDEVGANFPASIPEVTAVGGTEFDEGSGNYWNPFNLANGASAISYIPEMAWNDSAAAGTIQASGGGPSIIYSKPPWQSGPGVPADGVRDTPDVAMPASSFHDGFWACTGGSCFPGYGGTSFGAPVFAGIITLLNQSLVSKGAQSQAGLGNINPDLYRLAGAGSKAFHDITTGNNIIPCSTGTPNCSSGSYGYSAGPGYDMATGLGSVDVANLVNSWTNAGTQTTTSVTADNTSFSRNGSVQLSIAVASPAASAVPTGTVYVTLSNPTTALAQLPGGLPLGTATLAGGSATIQIYGGQLNAGANTIMVTYGGDARFNGSSTTIAVNVTDPSTNSAVVLSAFPYYYYSAYQNPPIPQIPAVQGTQWLFHLQLKEVDGVGTTVTGLSINGVDQSSTIASHFGAIFLDPFGTLKGTWGVNVPSVPVTIPVVFNGKDGDGTAWTTALQVPLTGGPEQFVVISNGGLVNAASFRNTFAPGMILSVFGGSLTNPSPGSGQAQSLPLPLTLAGSSATINGVPAPYYYASYGQVNIQVPYETAPGDAILTITGFAGQTFNYAFKVQPSAPGIFVDPNNDAPVPSESGSAGQEMVLYITGEGLVTPALATGATPAPGTPLDQLPKPKLPVTVTVGHLPAQIAFIGITPGIAGATQINYFIPPGTPSGFQPVIVSVGGVASPPAFLTVQ
jgi:uncharacterized protein (TIGR03437 family)